MANNFKSKQVVITTTGTAPIYTCNTVSCVVSSITVQAVQNSSFPNAECTLKFSKDGSLHKAVSVKKAIDSTPSDFLSKTWVMNDGDQFVVQTAQLQNVAELIINIHYLERTAAVTSAELSDLTNVSGATPSNGQVLAWNNSAQNWEPLTVDAADISGASDTSDLPEQSSGTEPFNRYMKDFDGLDALTNSGSDNPQDTMNGAPDSVVFVAENKDLAAGTRRPMKVTFGDLMAAIVTQGINDLANAGQGTVADYTFGGVVGDFNGDGEVGSADLLDFLVLYGGNWADATSPLFQPSSFRVTSSPTTSVTSSDETAPTVLSFNNADVAPNVGTQSITVTESTNTIRITEQGDPYFLDVLPNKELKFVLPGGALTLDVEEADTRFYIVAKVSLYDSSDNQLGSTGIVPMQGQLYFFDAGTQDQINGTTLTTTTEQMATATGATNGLDVDDLSYIEIQLAAYTNGPNIGVTINDLTVKLQVP